MVLKKKKSKTKKLQNCSLAFKMKLKVISKKSNNQRRLRHSCFNMRNVSVALIQLSLHWPSLKETWKLKRARRG